MIDQKRIRPALPFWSSSRLWVEESKRTLEVAAATEGSDNVKSTGMANENYMPQYIQLLHSLRQFKMHNTVLLYTQSTIVSSTSQLSTFNMASHHQLHQPQQNCNSSNSYIKATTFFMLAKAAAVVADRSNSNRGQTAETSTSGDVKTQSFTVIPSFLYFNCSPKPSGSKVVALFCHHFYKDYT